MKYPCVYVEWHDATSIDAWDDESEAIKMQPHLIRSVGWLIKEDKKSLTIALSWDEQGEQVSQYLVIPRTWIVEVIK